jgi:hypothetical protein
VEIHGKWVSIRKNNHQKLLWRHRSKTFLNPTSTIKRIKITLMRPSHLVRIDMEIKKKRKTIKKVQRTKDKLRISKDRLTSKLIKGSET